MPRPARVPCRFRPGPGRLHHLARRGHRVHGFTSAEILELLAALAAGLGGGATASRLGKSRNADKVDKLEQDNEAVRRSLARMDLEVARAVPSVHLSEPLL